MEIEGAGVTPGGTHQVVTVVGNCSGGGGGGGDSQLVSSGDGSECPPIQLPVSAN